MLWQIELDDYGYACRLVRVTGEIINLNPGTVKNVVGIPRLMEDLEDLEEKANAKQMPKM